MPKMDGIAATKAIKEIHPSAKIILMSGHSDQCLGCQPELTRVCPPKVDHLYG